jgi:uncharacterized membrane protein
MRKITRIGLLAALTYIFTAFIRLPIANGGYIHAGNIVIVVTACLLGPVAGGTAGAVGSAAADLFVAPVWTPYTVVIKFLLGLFVGTGYRKGGGFAALLYLAAGVAVVGGYYAAEAVIMGNWLTPAASVAALTLEYVISLVIGLIVSKNPALKNLRR